MYPADQTSWTAIAEKLAQEGYLVLTFDFRGYGESGGSTRTSRTSTVTSSRRLNYLRSAGASDIVLVGASMGGTASLIAATTLQAMSSLRLAGVVTLSAPVEFQGLSAADSVPDLVVPLLFVAAEDDAGAAKEPRTTGALGRQGRPPDRFWERPWHRPLLRGAGRYRVAVAARFPAAEP